MKILKPAMFVVALLLTVFAHAQNVYNFKVPCGTGFAVNVKVEYALNGKPITSNYSIAACGEKQVVLPKEAAGSFFEATCVGCSGCGTFKATPCDGPFDNGSSMQAFARNDGTIRYIEMTGTIFSNNIQIVKTVSPSQPAAVAAAPVAPSYASLSVCTDANIQYDQATGCGTRFPAFTNLQLVAKFPSPVPQGSGFAAAYQKVQTDGSLRNVADNMIEVQSIYFGPSRRTGSMGFRLVESGVYVFSLYYNGQVIGKVRFVQFSDKNPNPESQIAGGAQGTAPQAATPNTTAPAPAAATPPAPTVQPLIDAIRNNDYTKAESAIDQATVNTKDGIGRAPIHYAALADNKELIQLLKDRGNADLNSRDNNGKTPLDLALESSKFTAAKALLSNNADASQANSGLERVLATQNMDILKLMLQNGANANTALSKSIASDNLETMRFIFDNSSARASNGLFNEAIEKRSTKCAIGLLQNGIDKGQAMDFVISKRDKEMVDLVLNTGVDVANATKALTFFVEQRDIVKAEAAITNNFANATAGMPGAVSTNNIQMVNMLLRNHADPNDQMDEAAASGSNEMVTAFLSAGGNPDAGVKAAADNGKVATLQILLDNKGDANLAMPVAIAKNNTSMVQMCLTAGKPADVYRSEYVVTACENSNLDILNALLLAGAPADPGLIISVGKGDIRLVEALIKANAPVNRPDYMIKTAEIGNAGIAKLLLDAGADPNPGLPIAAGKKNAEMVDLMLEKGALPDPGMLPAVKAGDLAIVRKLIDKGGNAAAPDLVGNSVVHGNVALTGLLIDRGGKAEEGVSTALNIVQTDILSLLIDKGAAEAVRTNQHLPVPFVKNSVPMAKLLLDKGGLSPDWTDTRGVSLMEYASTEAGIEVINLLAQYHADANKKDVGGFTALTNAMLYKEKAGNRVTDVIRALLAAGADPNIANNEGMAPLHLVCKGDMKNSLREDCIVALLEKGANPCLADKKNNTPREYLPALEGGPRRKLKQAMKDGECR